MTNLVDVPKVWFYCRPKKLIVKTPDSAGQNVTLLPTKNRLEAKNVRFEINKDTDIVYITRPGDKRSIEITTWVMLVNVLENHLRRAGIKYDNLTHKVDYKGQTVTRPDTLLIEQKYIEGIDRLLFKFQDPLILKT